MVLSYLSVQLNKFGIKGEIYMIFGSELYAISTSLQFNGPSCVRTSSCVRWNCDKFENTQQMCRQICHTARSGQHSSYVYSRPGQALQILQYQKQASKEEYPSNTQTNYVTIFNCSTYTL